MWAVSASAQWIDYPTPGILRLPNGKGEPRRSGSESRGRQAGSDRTLAARARDESSRPADQAAGLAMGPNLADFMRPGETIPPLLPPLRKAPPERMANFMKDRPSSRCLPHGIPDQMLIGVPLKIVQNPGLTLILYEEFARFRQIFTDGRAPAPIVNPAWLGYSIGKWDGDWFVVDTRGFNDKSWLDDSGRPHTEALHTIERFRRRDFGHMDVEITIDDPQAYAKPW